MCLSVVSHAPHVCLTRVLSHRQISDGSLLLAHHAFFGVPQDVKFPGAGASKATITGDLFVVTLQIHLTFFLKPKVYQLFFLIIFMLFLSSFFYKNKK